jgi:hypothetical protein
MAAREEFRADQFTLWATYDFNIEKVSFNTNTHWGDKSFQIGRGGEEGQMNYDYILAGKTDERSNLFIELANNA